MRIAAALLALTLTSCGAPAAPAPADLGPQDAGPVCGLVAPPRGLCLLGQPDGSECDDNDACTSGDVCRAGVCAGAMQRLCVRCASDADCCAGPGSVICDETRPTAWAPTGTCTAAGVCQMAETACRAGVACEPGRGC